VEEDVRGAGVRFPPPLMFLMAILLGVMLNQYMHPLPILQNPNSGSYLLVIGGLVTLMAATVLIVNALYQLRRARTSIEPWRPTSNIVASGAFAISRNPIYLAFIGIDFSSALLLNNLWILLTLLPAIWGINKFVIAKEERYLRKKFASEYISYCAKVRRWI